MAKAKQPKSPSQELPDRIQKILAEAAQERARQTDERSAARAAVVYRPAIVTFIDILGFRNLVDTQDALQLFDSIQAIRTSAGSSDEPRRVSATDINWTRVHAFSDSVIRVRTYDSDFREGALFYELIDLVHAQTDLAGRGILVRGGMTAGNIYTSADLAYGPAFVRAYEIESKLSNYPRIVLDPQLIKAVREDTFNSLVALGATWGTKFVFLLDSDNSGLEQRERYALDRGARAEAITCLADFVDELEEIEDLLDDEALKIVAARLEIKNPPKKAIMRFFQEQLAKRDIGPLGAAFEERSRRVLEGLKEKLQGL